MFFGFFGKKKPIFTTYVPPYVESVVQTFKMDCVFVNFQTNLNQLTSRLLFDKIEREKPGENFSCVYFTNSVFNRVMGEISGRWDTNFFFFFLIKKVFDKKHFGDMFTRVIP